MNELFHEIAPVSADQWLAQVQKDLKGAGFEEKLVSKIEDIAIQPLYTRNNLPEFEKDESSEFLLDLDPEFTDAIQDNGTQTLTWNVAEEMLVNEDSDMNTLVTAARKRGASYIRLSVTSDRVWDHVVNEIIKLTTPANFTFNIDADLNDEDIVSKWRDRVGYLGERDRLLIGIEFDPIGYWNKNGEPEHKGTAFAHLADLFFRLSGHLHDCRLVKIDATAFAEKNDTAVEQLAQTLLITSNYFDQMEKRNVPLEELMQLVSFRFGIGTNFFFEIAKLRAFKILWNNFVKAYMPEMDFIPNPEIQCVTATASFTENDEHSNLLRTTTAAMSAILGGCDALIVAPFSKNEDPIIAQQLATNIQNLLRYESYIDRYRDAANGSFYIESLTASIGEAAWNRFVELKSN